MITEKEMRMLEILKANLNPPTNEELNHITAKWLFGKNAEKMLKFAPWSFLLVKLMWKKGEEPWES
jgi:hypothetical protein